MALSQQDLRPLAVRDNRYDPLNNFNEYHGGFELHDKHYWASVFFTGIPTYGIAASWILIGSILLFSSLYWNRQRPPTKKVSSSAFYYRKPLLLALICILFSIFFSVDIIVELGTLRKEGKQVVRTISTLANNIVGEVFGLTSNVDSLASVDTSSLGITALSQRWSSNTTAVINMEAVQWQSQLQDHLNGLDGALKNLSILSYALCSSQVLLLLTGFVLVMLLARYYKTRRVLHWLVIFCWIFTTVMWFSSGTYIVANSVADDACAAIYEFVQNPHNTTLEAILPCGELQERSRSALEFIQQGGNDLIFEVNSRIGEVRNMTNAPIPDVCNPFGDSADSMIQPCAPNTVPIGYISRALQAFACEHPGEHAGMTCSIQILSPNQFGALVAVSSGVNELVTRNVPLIQDLGKCSSVVNAFSIIQKDQCRPTKRAFRKMWIDLVGMASAAVVSIFCWLDAVRRRDQQFRWAAAITDMEQQVQWTSSPARTRISMESV